MENSGNAWTGPVFKACLVVFSALLYLFFDGRQFWVDEVKPYLSQETDTLSEQQSRVESSYTKVQARKPKRQAHHSKHQAGVDHQHTLRRFGRCQPHGGESVKYRVEHGIYIWVDSNGVTNYSDQKPARGAKTYQPRSSRVLDYFDLEISGQTISNQFKNTLSSRLNAIFRGYTSIVGLKAMRKVTLRVQVLPSRRLYERAVKAYGGDPTGTAGVYFGIKNIAFVEQTSYEATMQTAIHEAIHAINQAVIGFSPRWLNEGLAEYFETVEVSMQVGEVKPNNHITRSGYITGHVLRPSQLIGAEDTWKSSDPVTMYRSSWAFVHFLMSSKSGKQSLKALMLQEQKEPCSSLDYANVKRVLNGSYPNMQSAYAMFLNSQTKPQRL
ncbi:DUF1570 domain-containing protein [Pseudoalteromonas luteoviolacea]|uniref:DUF1570 domain-containing protein n=1 Tax=Pseudoalteromonas luteoviolacea NCIMB 1942 TaxID=1365253 RepID=A0A166Z2T5_9GAMM|nr:DUF1570 domain-containing protein [Pseudoalteromonas luteoviolacea]KZN43770.1 hypothetical protein N482_18785 [Pseudoalteromonas luteoviolacea NCIMB 1942]